MPPCRAALLCVLSLLAGCSSARSDPAPLPPLAWAYPRASEGPLPDVPGNGPFHVPGSRLSFTRARIEDRDNLVDWFPGGHPAPPAIVARGGNGRPTPCAECHLYNGLGFIAAADINGLDASYIVAQVKAFRDGNRRSAERDRPDTMEMVAVAQQVSDADLAAAAAYYAALPRVRRVRVVETATAPATRPSHWGWLDAVPGAPPEPIDGRIVELPEDFRRMMLGDDHVLLVDYVPRGSVARGAALAKSGGGAGQPCRACHGEDLRGSAIAPPLAGRPATYLARMLWDIRTGARGGESVAPMQPVAKGLDERQITEVAAYLASLRP